MMLATASKEMLYSAPPANAAEHRLRVQQAERDRAAHVPTPLHNEHDGHAVLGGREAGRLELVERAAHIQAAVGTGPGEFAGEREDQLHGGASMTGAGPVVNRVSRPAGPPASPGPEVGPLEVAVARQPSLQCRVDAALRDAFQVNLAQRHVHDADAHQSSDPQHRRVQRRAGDLSTHRARVAESKPDALRHGIEPGETVATQANFLIDSESRLKAALAQMSGGGHGGH